MLIGAALALVGGLISQAVFLFIARRHQHNVLLTALRAELRVLRGAIDSAVGGYRASLKKGEHPSSSVFLVHTPVFDANAGGLGIIDELDLIDHIVEVYSQLNDLKAGAQTMKVLREVSLQDFNDMHISATISQLNLMKLHNRLLGHMNPVNLSETEKETRRMVGEFPRPMTDELYEVLRNKQWHAVEP